MDDLVKIGGLWENETRGGETYYSGSLGQAKLLIFRNKKKESSKHPDFNVFVASKARKQAEQKDRDYGSVPPPPAEKDIPF
jgi:uncharacterized protein (DUF736 family)